MARASDNKKAKESRKKAPRRAADEGTSLRTPRKVALKQPQARLSRSRSLSNPSVPPITGGLNDPGEVNATIVLARARLPQGEALFIRGEGGGLDWSQGVPMRPLSEEDWVWSQTGLTGPVEFKIVRNDRDWAGGENRKVWPGERLEVRPDFSGR